MSSKPNVARIYSCFATGTDSTVTMIEVSISPGIPTFSVIGLCDSSIRESQGRLRSAFKSAGFNMPKGHITIGISPAYMRKAGTGFDLPMALGILFASGQLYLPQDAKIYSEGELTLSGEVKGTPGACIRLKTVKDMDFNYRIIPKSESNSAGIAGFTGHGVSLLSEASAIFDENKYEESLFDYECLYKEREIIDVSMLKGQEKAKRALLISAAGFHNILLLGSQGSGKTMAGMILSGLMPDLNREELGDVYSLNELVEGESTEVSPARPVRIVGPGITVGKLVGNALCLTPGELALANHGILFADELPLFKTDVVDFLRKPLEEHRISMMRRGNTYSFDCNSIFIGTGNPCRCGYLYEKGNKCRCTNNDISRYLSKINGPFLERIDLFSEMRSINRKEMTRIYSDSNEKESPIYRERVKECWQIANRRYGGGYFNGNFPDGDIRDSMRVSDKVVQFASELAEKGFFSARGFTRILRVARTIADLNGADDVSVDDVSEALQFRIRRL